MLLLLLLQSKIDLCDAASLSLLSLGAAVLCALANACRWNLVWGINRAFDGRVAKATCRESTACCLVIWPQWLLCGMVEGLAFFLFTQSNVVIGSSEVGCQSFTSAPTYSSTMPPANNRWRESPLAMSPRAIAMLLNLGCPILMLLASNMLKLLGLRSLTTT